MSPLIEKAKAFARKAHEGQVRKYDGEPYVNHPIRISCVAAGYGLSVEAIAAALLHDVIEDCGVSAEEIENEFSLWTANYVVMLTDVTTLADGNRKTRKNIELERLRYIAPEAKSIKVLDIMDNARSILEHDPKFAEVFIPEAREIIRVLGPHVNKQILRTANHLF